MKKIVFFALLFPLLLACGDEPSEKDTVAALSFSEKEMSVSDFETCKNSKCPEIKISYLWASGAPEISDKINGAIQKHHARLLKETEGEAVPDSLKTAIRNFISEFKRFKSDYPESVAGYAFTLNDSIARHSDSLLVVKTKYYIFTGGAHGYGATNFLSFNTQTGKKLNKKDLFTHLDAFTAYAENLFREKFEIPKDENINSTGFFFEDNTFALPNNIGILKDEVILLYNPYEAASYAQGQLVLRIPENEVRQWLKYE
ncbi:MAG TPA: DUF4163 domain-containing protein [Salinimicrobium sp.]|nr:DUF4163 domain-containing protein [Salinimicrobium sp.]